jgi:nitronate monooxygenase
VLETRFTQLVGCGLPVQQAPMGSVSSPALAVAVAAAGGVGSITALGMPPEHLASMLTKMSAQTDGAIAVNFLTEGVDRDALEVAAAHVRIVDFFWSDPDPRLVKIAKGSGALTCWQVGSADEARAAVDAGCDIVAVQGSEAGGHVRGHAALLPLLSAVLDAVEVPVVAAGGIGDGRALAAVIAAGADGARIGTRFIASSESGAHAAYKNAVVEATAGTTAITDAFAVCPLCATSPRARVLQSCIDAVSAADADVVGEGSMGGRTIPVPRGSGLPPGESTTGNVSAMAMYASDAVASITAIQPAAQIIAELCAGAERCLAATRD